MSSAALIFLLLLSYAGSALASSTTTVQDRVNTDTGMSGHVGETNLLFSCAGRNFNSFSLYIDRSSANQPAEKVSYMIRIRKKSGTKDLTLWNATEFTQTASQAQALVMSWKLANGLARFEYYTDWAPTLRPFASLKVVTNRSTQLYECRANGMRVNNIEDWPSKAPGETLPALNMWALSYYGLASSVDSEGEIGAAP